MYRAAWIGMQNCRGHTRRYFFLARLVAREKTGAAMQIDTCIGRVA
jgi:hypothetical protein